MAFPIHAEFGPDEWTQYRLNTENNAVYDGEGIEDSLNLKLKTENEIRSTPVVVGDNVFIGNHNSGDIYSYNLISGKLNWQSKAPNWIHSEIIYVDDQLFVGYGNRFFQKDGTRGTEESGLLSLDPETGEILWNFETKGEVMPTPAYNKGTVYITTGDSHLYGVDPATGKEKWKLNLGNVVSMSSPNIKDGVLYVGGGRPQPYTFFAVDLNKTEILWKTELEEVMSGLDDVPPAIYKDLVITTGVEETEKKIGLKEVYDHHGLAAAYKEIVKRASGRDQSDKQLYDHKIYAMNTKNGNIVWEKSLGVGEMVPNNKSGAPVIYKDSVYVGSPITKKFYSLDAKTGENNWRYHSNVTKAPPAADKDIVYFMDVKGLVYAFDTSSGKLLGKNLFGGKLAPSGPVLINNHLIAGSQDGNVTVKPTDKILDKFDDVKGDASGPEASAFEYYGLVYGIPIGIVLACIIIAGLVILKVRKKK
ncbi:PQQ-binding-like beta-propeller repeat protein [Rossellomorea oryzaecorticis]|uniref:PQQ-binding-like beta-propeller repeat protein n=1 Tax=Rossellomorea oryzaecorticis TaxID=1396505 RepID=A0ABU9K459_9BACI